MAETHTNVLVRMTNEMKALLQKEALVHDVSLTKEITNKLQASLKMAAYAQAEIKPPLTAEQPRASYGNTGLSEVDKAMLAVFRAMPVDKQLALLSLFK